MWPIVNVALPSIKTDLHFSRITAVGGARVPILFAAPSCAGGRLAILFGRPRLILVRLALSQRLASPGWPGRKLLIFFLPSRAHRAALLSPAAPALR